MLDKVIEQLLVCLDRAHKGIVAVEIVLADHIIDPALHLGLFISTQIDLRQFEDLLLELFICRIRLYDLCSHLSFLPG